MRTEQSPPILTLEERLNFGQLLGMVCYLLIEPLVLGLQHLNRMYQ